MRIDLCALASEGYMTNSSERRITARRQNASRGAAGEAEQRPNTFPPNVQHSLNRVLAENARKRSGPPQDVPWTWISREMLESPAWRAMSRGARIVVDRVMAEYVSHAGLYNGDLQITYENFVAFGLGRKSIKAAIDEAQALGWIKVTQRGRGGQAGSLRRAHRFALTWLPVAASDPTNGWKRFQTKAMVNTALAKVRKLRTPPTRKAK
jgi:hypothetical protein